MLPRASVEAACSGRAKPYIGPSEARRGGRRMSQNEVQLWALLVGFLLLGIIVGVLFVRRRRIERAGGSMMERGSLHRWERTVETEPSDAPVWEPGRRLETVPRSERRSPDPAPPASAGELASAIRSLIL